LELLGRDPALREIYDPYRTLKDRSEEARYELAPFSNEDVLRLYEQELVPIRERLMGLLGNPSV